MQDRHLCCPPTFPWPRTFFVIESPLITARIQSKSNKIHHRPDPVQSKSSPMLISDLQWFTS